MEKDSFEYQEAIRNMTPEQIIERNDIMDWYKLTQDEASMVVLGIVTIAKILGIQTKIKD